MAIEMSPTSVWKSVKLRDYVDMLTGFPFKSSEYTQDESGARLLRGDNVAQGELRWDGVKRWPVLKAAAYQKYELQVGDVILAMDRPWIEAGLKYAWIRLSDLPALLVQRVARLRGKHGLLTEYIRYLIGSPAFTSHVHTVTTGTAVPHISGGDIGAFEFSLPPLAVQRKIASILSTYDDLIENNTRRIAILEEMARALYREWFVNFRFPGHEGIRMAESELGPIPEGWKVGVLQDAIELQRGFDLPVSRRRKGDIPVYSAGGQHGWHTEAKVKGPGVLTARAGSIGTVMYTHQDFWPLNTTLWVKEFRRVSPIYAFYLLRTLDFGAINSGLAVPMLNRNYAYRLPTVLPPREFVALFDVHAIPLFAMQRSLEVENVNLRRQRDLLLPKLVSGEVDVEGLEVASSEVPGGTASG